MGEGGEGGRGGGGEDDGEGVVVSNHHFLRQRELQFMHATALHPKREHQDA